VPPRLPFDLDLLRSFVLIAEAGGVTRAAERLGRTQSTVSLQLKRLEDGLGQVLLDRERHFAPTANGELLLGYARRILALANEARARMTEPDVDGPVRLGTPEDFATMRLPDVLWRFARAHPRVALEVSCDFTANLAEGFERGAFDIVLLKREPRAATGGTLVWQETLVWASSERLVHDPEDPLPLVLAPSPDIYRRRALDALEAAGRPWRIAYTSPSLAGVQAAVRAGLGVTVLPKDMLLDGFTIVDAEFELPVLMRTEIALHRAPTSRGRASDLLAEHIVRSLEEHRSAPSAA